MADTGKQSPLGVNVLGSLLGSTGLTINTVSASYMGQSKTNASYTFGKLVNDTVLRLLTYSINDGYLRGPGNSNATLTDTTYNNLISIGTTSIGALGNSKPNTYIAVDPSSQWTNAGTPATTGYSISGNTGQGQSASWLPYNTTNVNKSVTQWGYIRLHALQAWNEFNYNGISPTASNIEYKDFCGSYMTASGFINQMNSAILSSHNANSFLDGVYSNMDDLVSADIAGINLSSKEFGIDLENLGKVINFNRIDAFGLPSVLLATIGKNSAVTQDLSLLLLASGLSTSEINNLLSGDNLRPSMDQESKIYGAFLLITGMNLEAVLAPLQCKTNGLVTLADLLDVRKLFPNSYASLTVPMYNGQLGLPTNSKTYYLIYKDGGINSALLSPEMNEYVGEQIPSGPPPINDYSLSPENYVTPTQGFGSYLKGILPDDQATAAGALQFTLRQVRRIDQVNFKKFAKAAKGVENMMGLPLVSGTSKPTNQTAIDTCNNTLALGSGPYGSYTLSDFFGCMSGLPYPWKLIYDRINQLQNTKLQNIYHELFLATTWEQATASGSGIQFTPPYTGPGDYTITGLVFDDMGGGYGRGTAADPVVTFTFSSDTFTTTAIVDRNDLNAGSNSTGTFGRLISIVPITVNVNHDIADYTVSIEAPPIDTLPVSGSGEISTSGVNYPAGTTGWNNPMNTVVQDYIDQANSTILDIETSNPGIAEHLNSYWNTLGAQLMIEQRARYIGIYPVPISARDNFLNPYPSSLVTFVDSISSYAQETRPHMSAQQLENIVDLSTLGGQSIVGLMRQERNQTRLNDAGITLDNNIPDSLSDMDVKTLTTNGTLENAGYNNDINGYTNPAWSTVQLANNVVSPEPTGVYIPTDTAFIGTYVQTSSVAPGDITNMLNKMPNAMAATLVPSGPTSSVTSPVDNIVIIQPPAQLDPSNVPVNLDPNYTNSTLLPSSPNVQAAIIKVNECNCDCWIG